MNICKENLNEDEKAAKEKLIADILKLKTGYTRDIIEKAIKSCCVETNHTEASFDCVSKRTEQFYLFNFKPGQ